MEHWKHGQRARLAESAGITPTHLNHYLKKRRNAPSEIAVLLETGSKGLGLFISRHDFVNAKNTDNPLFY